MKNNNHTGFVQLIVMLVIVLIVLGYFGFNIEKILKSPMVSGNLSYVWNLAVTFWNNFLVGPATFVWDKIIVELIWNNLTKLFS